MVIAELIVYACPVGELADQVMAYFDETKRRCGPNAAHAYMPHCTLTGFFHDDLPQIPMYATALGAALERARPAQPRSALRVEGMVFADDFHYIALDSPWLRTLIADFARAADSATRVDRLRLKDRLHLSLAYTFPPEQAADLARIARDMVNVDAPVRWDLCLYERHPDGSWTCHARWPIDCAD